MGNPPTPRDSRLANYTNGTRARADSVLDRLHLRSNHNASTGTGSGSSAPTRSMSVLDRSHPRPNHIAPTGTDSGSNVPTRSMSVLDRFHCRSNRNVPTGTDPSHAGPSRHGPLRRSLSNLLNLGSLRTPANLAAEQVTFGIEIEFYRRIVKLAGRSSDCIRKTAQEIADKSNLPVACPGSPDPCAACLREGAWCPHATQLSVLQQPQNLAASNSANLDQVSHYFYVKPESLAHQGDEETGWTMFPLEISSPAHTWEERRAGLPALRKIFSVLAQSETKTKYDSSAGLHVHVGLKDGLNPLTAKKAITIVMILEMELLRQLVSTARRGGHWAFPVIADSRYGRHDVDESDHWVTGSNCGLDDFCPIDAIKTTHIWTDTRDPITREHFHKSLEYVWKATSLNELRAFLLTPDEKGGITIAVRPPKGNGTPSPDEETEEVEDNLKRSPSTIEFRYQEMHWDVPTIRNWVDICCKIMEIAQLDAPGFRAMVETLTGILSQALANNTHSSTWERLLKAIGLGHQVRAWREQIERYKRGETLHIDANGYLRSRS